MDDLKNTGFPGFPLFSVQRPWFPSDFPQTCEPIFDFSVQHPYRGTLVAPFISFETSFITKVRDASVIPEEPEVVSSGDSPVLSFYGGAVGAHRLKPQVEKRLPILSS